MPLTNVSRYSQSSVARGLSPSVHITPTRPSYTRPVEFLTYSKFNGCRRIIILLIYGVLLYMDSYDDPPHICVSLAGLVTPTVDVQQCVLTINVSNNPAVTCLDDAALRAVSAARPTPDRLFAIRYVNTIPAANAMGASVVASSLW